MELTLKRQQGTQVAVICDGQPSHTFDLSTLVPTDKEGLPHFLDDPGGYGRAVYQALFPPESLARRGLGQLSATFPARLLLVPTDSLLDAIPWEYAYGPFGGDDSRDPERFLVCACHFVRGLPAEQRIPVPKRKRNLHLIAVPSDPLGHDVVPLDIESEWMRLKEIMQELPYALTLERTRPSTVERVRQLLANQQGRVLHFMGHGGQDGQGAFLCFEQDNGALKRVRAAELIGRVRGTVFLVTLNACVSAAPELTVFGNLAAALVQQKVPYALGMRSSIVDADARTFSHTFYSELARGSSVEEALFQARLSLAESPRPWVIGVPVLYTALEAPSPGFAPRKGTPTIHAHPPRLDASALPPVDGTFQGRIDELVALGTELTGDARPSLITIHGSGGQGKTALALKAAERFAWAWPGGVWATPLENLPDRATFVTSLAHFLGIETQERADPHSVEQAVLTRLQDRRVLIVLDNAETLVEAVKKNDATALHLVGFLKKLPSPSVSLLVTSRDLLGWSGERTYELRGLSSQKGAALFLQCVPDPRLAGAVTFAQAQQLSQKLDGHPLGLRLLGGAFNTSALTFDAFLKTYEGQLVKAKDIYVGEEHRHYQLYACIEISVRALESELRSLLSGLWVFHAPFLEDTAVAIFDPQTEETEHTPSPVRDCLHALWQRSLLTHRTVTVRDGKLPLYSLLPTTRPYIEHHLEPAYDRETLQARFGAAYLQIARWLYRELDRSAAAVTLAQQAREDLERAGQYVTGGEQGYYLLWRGWMVHRLGNPEGLQFLEHALEMAQGVDPDLERQALNNMAGVYSDTGRPQEALKLYEQALPIRREVGDRAGEATTLNNMALVYSDTGRPQEALKLYEQALPITREVGDRAGEATTLNNMAGVYSDTGRPQEALKLYEQALPIRREVGDRAGEATTLNNMAGVYRATGRPQEALKLYEQALPITREVGDRAGEATTLNNMAGVYSDTGRPQEALKLYEQALPIRREVGDRAGEATTLNNMAGVYRATGRPQEALKLYEQALPITREVGDRAGEATTLNNMALVYSDTGRPQEALKLYEQALPITREVGDRAGEATTLNNMAGVYSDTGRPQEALKLYEQALPIRREVGDRAGEATTLNNMAGVYRATGRPQEALKLYEQALPIRREVGDRAGEATTLNNMALVYSDTGRPQEALKLYEQALPIRREVGDRAGEAATLNNMAGVYRATGRPQEALKLYEQALPITREVGDRAGEAATLNNMAGVYRATGRPQEALKLYEQALPITREVGDRAGEAATLNNMAGVYNATGRPQEALKLYEQALPIRREVGDHAGEAATLNGLAYLYQSLQRYAEAQAAFEASLTLERQVVHPAGEVAGLVGLGLLLYRHLNHPTEAITSLEQAIALLQATGLPQDAAGHTLEQLQQILDAMRVGTFPGADGPSTLPTAHIQQMVSNTVAVMTIAQDHLPEWREQMAQALRDAQHRGTDWQMEADFFTAVLDILDGRSPTLPNDHPYAQAVTAIEQGIAAGGPERVSVSDEVMQAIREFVNSDDWEAARHAVEARQELLFRPEVEAIFEQNIDQAKSAGEERAIRLLELHLSVLRECKQDGIAQTFERLTAAQEEEHLPFDEDLIPRSIKALLSSPQEKLAHVQYLAPLAAQTTDEQLKALINTIQLALFERDLSQLGEHLEGVYRQAWESILAWVATEGVDPRWFEAIVRNTPAVFGPAAQRRSEWRESLLQIRTRATSDGTTHLVALLDAVIGLLDADGNPAGLGAGLTGIYEQTWQEVLTHLPQQK